MWLLWLGVIGTFAPGGVALGASAVSLDSPWLEIETFLFVVFFVGYVTLIAGFVVFFRRLGVCNKWNIEFENDGRHKLEVIRYPTLLEQHAFRYNGRTLRPARKHLRARDRFEFQFGDRNEHGAVVKTGGFTLARPFRPNILTFEVDGQKLIDI